MLKEQSNNIIYRNFRNFNTILLAVQNNRALVILLFLIIVKSIKLFLKQKNY